MWCADEELEGERAPRDLLLPRPVVRPHRQPALPHSHRRVEPRLDVLATRPVERILVGRDEREERRSARGDLERARERGVLGRDLAGVPRVDGDLHVGARRDEHAVPAHDPRRLPSPVEARLDAPLELDLAVEPLDPPRVLDPRKQPAVLQGQGVGDANDAAAGAVCRLEDVRAPDVPA